MRRGTWMVKLSQLGTSRIGLAREMLDERLPAARSGDGESSRAFSQVRAKSRSTMVVSDRMAGWEGTS